MNMSLEMQATLFLKERGFKGDGEPYITPSIKEDRQQEENRASKDLFATIRKKSDSQEIEVMDRISGSFATRPVCYEELSFLIDIDFKKNTKFGDTSYFEWRLHNLIAQRYFMNGYGIYHYQFIPKKGAHFALYKLLDDEMEKYKENYYRVCERLNMTREGLRETKRLYGIDKEENYELVPGKRYVKHAKRISDRKRKTLEKMFAKYQVEVRKCIEQY